MTDLIYETHEWVDAGCRHVTIKVNMFVKPYVRQTRNSRYRRDALGERARAYNDSQASLRDVLRQIMAIERIEPFGREKLGFASWFWLCPKKEFRAKKYAQVDNPEALDLGNLEKAIEDVCNDTLYVDDRQIWVRERGFKMEWKEDWYAIHVWQAANEQVTPQELQIPGQS